jgi:hypothetical protein
LFFRLRFGPVCLESVKHCRQRRPNTFSPARYPVF